MDRGIRKKSVTPKQASNLRVFFKDRKVVMYDSLLSHVLIISILLLIVYSTTHERAITSNY